MQNKNWKESLEIIALVAVVISLLVVAYQVQQANRIAIATAEIEVSHNFAAYNEFMMSHPELLALGRRLDAGEEIDEKDRQLLRHLSRRNLNLWRGLETAYKNGVLPESTYKIAFDDMKQGIEMGSVERRRVWREVLDLYPSLADTEIFQAAYAALDRAEEKAQNQP